MHSEALRESSRRRGDGARDVAPLMPPFTTAGSLAVVYDRRALSGRGRGLLVTAAADVSPQLINEMIHLGRGISTLLVDMRSAFSLGFRDMPLTETTRPRADNEPRYLASVEAAAGVSTGISAGDRAQTIRAAGQPGAIPDHFVSPGHVMPLLVPSFTSGYPSIYQAALDLVKQTSTSTVAAACDILDESGEVASYQACLQLARRHGLGVLEV